MTANLQCLTGLRVIDASRVLAGPYCAQILGDQGADVIKIESPDGDETRTFGPAVTEDGAAYFQALNRNKRGIVLDMSKPRARDVFWQLLAKADVLIENFKASTLRSWGIESPAAITARFPRLVHCRITGFGDDGPLGGVPGYDAAIQAVSGLMSINGEPEGQPLRMSIPVVDLTTAMQAAIAVLSALHERARSGLGQMCDLALYDSAISVALPHVPNYLWSGQEPVRAGNGHANIAPYDAFKTATCGIYIAVANDRQFAALCEVLGQPELARDPRFAGNVQRVAQYALLKAKISELLRTQDGHALADRLQSAGVPSAPILSIAQVAKAPQTLHRRMVIDEPGYHGSGFPIKFSRTPGTLRRLPPRPGEHTREVLAEAGLDARHIDALHADGSVGRGQAPR